MNRIVEGRNQPPPKAAEHDPNWEQKAIVRLHSEKPPCDHYSIRRDGQIVCQKCEAVWNLGINGPVWAEKDA